MLSLKVNEKRCPRLGSWSTVGVGELVNVGVEDGDGVGVGEGVLVGVAEGTGVLFFFFFESEPQPATEARSANAAASVLSLRTVGYCMQAGLVPDILVEVAQGRGTARVRPVTSRKPETLDCFTY